MLDPPGDRALIISRKKIIDYMRAYFESWVEFANSEHVAIGIPKEDILLVSGTIKTERWMVGVFQGDDVRAKKTHISGKVGPFAGMELKINAEDRTLPTTHSRRGPDAESAARQVYPMVASGGVPERSSEQFQDTSSKVPDQCIFIHYWKMRSRRFLLPSGPIKAGAGPHRLPRNLDDPPSPSAVSLDPEEAHELSDVEPEFSSFPGVTKASMKVSSSYVVELLIRQVVR